MRREEPLQRDPIARAGELWAEHVGDPSVMVAVTNLMRVQQILQYAVDDALRPLGLTFARYEALMLLHFSQHGRLPMSVMGRRLQLHPTSVTNIVDRLEADALTRRSRPPTDRRTVLVEITPDGERVRAAATTVVVKAGFGMRGLTSHQTVMLTSLLTKIRKANGDFTEDVHPTAVVR
jgi:DNA-binding MarR family transcriptional regulator